jgi:hypothetical protein
MNEECDLAAIAAFLMGQDLDDVSSLRGAMREARTHLLRAMDCLAAEGRDSLMDPVHTAVGRALGALTRALLPEAAELPEEGDEEPEPAVAGPHPTAAEEGNVAWPAAGLP